MDIDHLTRCNGKPASPPDKPNTTQMPDTLELFDICNQHLELFRNLSWAHFKHMAEP